jgi:hypothetical protein
LGSEVRYLTGFGRKRRSIEPPVVRIRRSSAPHPACAERRTRGGGPPSRAPDGPQGFRGFSEDRGRRVAPYRFGAPGKPFRRRSGVPFRSAGQKPSPRASPLSTSRAPEGALRRCDADQSRSAPPSPAQSPSAYKGPRIRSSRACLTRHLPPSAFLTPSAACTPRPRPGLFHPGDAHGVSPSGPCSSPGGRTSFEAVCSRAVRIPSRRVAAPCGYAVFRALLSPESPSRERPKTRPQSLPSWRSPL